MAFFDLARRAGPFVIVLAAGIWLWTVANDFAIKTIAGTQLQGLDAIQYIELGQAHA